MEKAAGMEEGTAAPETGLCSIKMLRTSKARHRSPFQICPEPARRAPICTGVHVTHKRRKAKNRKWLGILQNWGKITVLPGILLSPLTPSSLLSNETGRVLPALVRALPGIAGIAGVADTCGTC